MSVICFGTVANIGVVKVCVFIAVFAAVIPASSL